MKNDGKGKGKGAHLRKPYLASYEEAKVIVKEHGIKTYKQYLAWKPRPYNMPSQPRITYKDEYEGNREFFGTLRPTLKQLKKILIKEGIRTQVDFFEAKEVREEHNIPWNLSSAYKKEGFSSITELLGNEKPWDFKDQRDYMHNRVKAIITSSTEFNAWSASGKRPSFISSRPDRKFGKTKGTGEWQGWADFLGSE